MAAYKMAPNTTMMTAIAAAKPAVSRSLIGIWRNMVFPQPVTGTPDGLQ
jgi:hypothetical protein